MLCLPILNKCAALDSVCYDRSLKLTYFEQCFIILEKIGHGSFGEVCKAVVSRDLVHHGLFVRHPVAHKNLSPSPPPPPPPPSPTSHSFCLVLPSHHIYTPSDPSYPIRHYFDSRCSNSRGRFLLPTTNTNCYKALILHCARSDLKEN